MKASTNSVRNEDNTPGPGSRGKGDGPLSPGKGSQGRRLPFRDRLKKLEETHPRLYFLCQVLGFYALLMILYFYFMAANLSTAPKFVYTQF